MELSGFGGWHATIFPFGVLVLSVAGVLVVAFIVWKAIGLIRALS
jgi:hypothetical protein